MYLRNSSLLFNTEWELEKKEDNSSMSLSTQLILDSNYA